MRKEAGDMNIITLLSNEVKATVRKPALLFFAFLIPFFILGFIGGSLTFYLQKEAASIRAAVVDEDRTLETRTLVNLLQEEQTLARTLSFVPMSLEEAERALTMGKIAALIQIPKGFTDDLRVGANTPITVITLKEKPLASAMIRMLMESGAKYISAAQSAVNTVYDLHLQYENDPEKRKQQLQQIIVTFTLLALSRNDLFQEERLPLVSEWGWAGHGLIAWYLTGLSFSALLLNAWFETRTKDALRLRLLSFGLTELHFWFADLLKFFLFFLLASELFWLLTASGWEKVSALRGAAHLVLGAVSLFLAALLLVFQTLEMKKTNRMLGLLSLTIGGLMLGGVWVPGVYFPVRFQEIMTYSPFHTLYLLLSHHVLSQQLPAVKDAAVMILWILCFLGWGVGSAIRKERKNGYLSPVKPAKTS